MSDLEIKRKKLIMRSMRRGTKEMDLILKNFSKLRLDFMTEEELELYEKLLSENDQDLYQWCTGQSCAKQEFETLIVDIKDFISDSGGLLVLSEIYYKPGWKATVNGSETPIYQTNHILRSVEVPPGEIEVIFEYDTNPWERTRILSRVSFLSVILFLGLSFWRNQTKHHK